MIWCWLSSVVYYRWMGVIVIQIVVYVWKMGFVIVCFLIVIEVFVVGVLERLCELFYIVIKVCYLGFFSFVKGYV